MAWFADLLPDVVRRLRGPENKGLSRPEHLRFGTHGSLSVERKNGTWVWYSHEETAGGGVLDFLRAEGMHNGVAIDWMKTHFGAEPPQKPEYERIENNERIWSYVDENGEVTLEVVRSDGADGKRYFQRVPLGEGRYTKPSGIWKPIPYRLPELVAAHANKYVFVVEGEKCADALARLGLTATTNAMGAKKWQPELTPYFAGRKVVIVPDTDKVGREHAEIVREALAPVAASLITVELPGLDGTNGSNDIEDWIARGGTKAKLQEIVKAAAARQVERPRLKIYSYDEMVSMPPVEWQIEGVLPARSKTVLFGVSNAFKSFIAIDMACSVATGTPWHGASVKQGPVLYIATEGAFGVGRKRIPAWMSHHRIPKQKRNAIAMMTGDVILKGDQVQLAGAITAFFGTAPACIVIDVLTGTMDGSESDDEAAREWVNAATDLVLKMQTALLVVTHSPYSDDGRMRGHSHIWGSFDTRLKADGNKDAKTTTITVNRHKDHDSAGTWNFQLVEQPTDENPGERSLVVTLSDGVPNVAEKRLTPQQQDVFDALKVAVEEFGECIALPNIPPGVNSVKMTDWRRYFYATSTLSEDAGQKAFRRASEALRRKGTIGVWSGRVWISET